MTTTETIAAPDLSWGTTNIRNVRYYRTIIGGPHALPTEEWSSGYGEKEANTGEVLRR